MPPEARISIWIEPPFAVDPAARWRPAGRAYANAIVSFEDRTLPVDFLIDTGASHTMLGTMPALKLFEDAYFGIEFDRDPSSGAIRGVGGAVRTVVRELGLSFLVEGGARHSITAHILIPEMTDAPPGRLPMHTPSLLGRDLLGAGALTLAYRLPTELHFSNMPTGISL